MQRIILHWTAGGSRASDTDKQHYHRLVEYDGTIVAGTHEVADNIVTSDGDYAAHTRNLNTGSIGVSLCGMRGATEHPFSAGPSPLTEKQWRVAMVLIADLCRQYSIPVTRETVLTHAEVQPTLGVIQRGKWDITRLPFKPDLVGAIPVGDYMRQMVREVLGEDTPDAGRPTLRMGNRAPREDVRRLQADLAALGYHTGAVDGKFGQRTRAAVMALQADHGLIADGVVGPQTWAAMDKAAPMPARLASVDDLRERGSGTIADADRAQTVAKAGAGVVLGGAGLDTALEVAGKLDGLSGLLPSLQAALIDNWIILGVGAAALVGWFWVPRLMDSIRERRVADHVTGKNLGR